MSTERQVARDVTFNGDWYIVNTPSGETWSFDEGDMDVAYAESALYAWSRWLDFVTAQKDGEAEDAED